MPKETNYDANILDIESKYFTASDYNIFANEIINNMIKEKELVNNIRYFWIHRWLWFKQEHRNTSSKSRIKSRAKWNSKTSSTWFKSFWRWCLEKFGNSIHISEWKSEILPDVSIKPSATSDKSLAPSLRYIGVRQRINFDSLCLKQDKVTFTHKNFVNIYTVFEINLWSQRVLILRWVLKFFFWSCYVN